MLPLTGRLMLGMLIGMMSPSMLYGQHMIWEEAYGSRYRDQARAVVPVNPEEHIIYGHMRRDVTFYPGPTKLYLTRTDTAGNRLWLRNFEFQGLVTAGDVVKTAEGGFLITATLRQPDQTQHLVWKLNKAGKPVWRNRQSWKAGVAPMVIEHSPEGGFFLMGAGQPSHRYADSTHKGLLVQRIDSEGEEQFQNILGYEEILRPVSFGRMDEQHYYTIARSSSGRPFFMKGENLDGQFLAELIKPVKLKGNDYQQLTITDAHQTQEGQFLLAGSAIVDNGPKTAQQPSAWLCKVDEQADLIWSKVYDTKVAQAGLAVIGVPDQGLVISGYQGQNRRSNKLEDREGWLAGVSLEGRLLWEKAFGAKQVNQINELSPIPNSAEYLASGKTARKVRQGEPRRSNGNAWLSKFDTAGFYQPEPVSMTPRVHPDQTYASLQQLIVKMRTGSSARALNRLLYRHRLIPDPEQLTNRRREAALPFHPAQLSIDTFQKNLFGDQRPEVVLQLREAGCYVINVFHRNGQNLQKVPGRISNHFSDRHLSTDFVFYFENIGRPQTFEIATKKSWQYNRSDNERVTFYDITAVTMRLFYRVATKNFSYSGLRTYKHDTKRTLTWQEAQGYPKRLVINTEGEHESDLERRKSGGKVIAGRKTDEAAKRVVQFESTPHGLAPTRITKDISRTITIINPGSDNR